MKKMRIALSLSVVAFTGAIAAVCVATGGNQTLPLGINKVITKNEKLPVRAEGGVVPGNAFYLVDYSYSQFYVGNSYNVWAHFFSTTGSGVCDLNLGNSTTFTWNSDSYDRKVVEGRVPEYAGNNTNWDRVLFVRVASWSDHIIWPDQDPNNAANKTNDIVLSSSSSLNAITVNDSSQGTYNKHVTAETRISKWASSPNQWTSSGICVQDGSTDSEALETSWNATKVSYSAIAGDDVKSYFSNLEGAEEGSEVEQIAFRYDHILSKHSSYENFANR